MALTPAIFFGHGSPMLTLSRNRFTKVWAELGQALRKPKAIVCISAHYFVPSTEVVISTSPRTIHDFGGFPQVLYDIQYPAPGDPELARRIGKMLAPLPVDFTERGALTTAPGPSCVTFTRTRTCRPSFSAWTCAILQSIITRSGAGWRPCGKRMS